MIKKSFILTTLLCLSALNVTAQTYQGDPKLGKLKTPSCGFCHGVDGVAILPHYPNLNGQKEGYLFNTMKAYQNGDRTGPFAEMMRQQLSRLNDQDLADIAAFYAQMQKQQDDDK